MNAKSFVGDTASTFLLDAGRAIRSFAVVSASESMDVLADNRLDFLRFGSVNSLLISTGLVAVAICDMSSLSTPTELGVTSDPERPGGIM